MNLQVQHGLSDDVVSWVGGDAPAAMVCIGKGVSLVVTLRQILRLLIRISRDRYASSPF